MNEDEILTAQPQGLSPALRAQERKELAAVKRIVLALWSDETPSADDVRIANVCGDCYGYGDFYRHEHSVRKTKCKSCGGNGKPHGASLIASRCREGKTENSPRPLMPQGSSQP